MSIATVVTRGYGSFGTIPFVVTAGYSIGPEAVAVIADRLDTLGLFKSSITTGQITGAETRGAFKIGKIPGIMK